MEEWVDAYFAAESRGKKAATSQEDDDPLPCCTVPLAKKMKLSLHRRTISKEADNTPAEIVTAATPIVAQEPLSESKSNRFQFTNEEELEKLSKGFTPKNTALSTKWAVTAFTSWVEARNAVGGGVQKCPENVLTSSAENICGGGDKGGWEYIST